MSAVAGTIARAGKALYSRRRKIPGGVAAKLRRRNKGGTGSYSQWTQDYKQGKFGRLNGRKIDRLSTERIIYTHRLMGPFNDYGQFFMSNYQEANGNQLYPLMMFELNSCNNVINSVITGQAPVYRMYQSGSQIGWLQANGQIPDGSATSVHWQLEQSPHANNQSGSFPLDQAIHKWSSLDLELWGCRNKPTKYHIMLCQLSEDVLPDWGNRTGQSAEFWQSMIKHYTYSPLAKMDDGYNRKKIKILKQYTYNIDPTASFENDPDPHVKTVKLYYRFNRMTNFQWQFSTPDVQSIANMNDADWRQENNQPQNQPHPNARLYVMVRASNFTKVVAPNVVDNTTNPSLSWRLRTAWMINN